MKPSVTDLIVVFVLLAAPAARAAERIVCQTLADTWVFVPPYEAAKARETEAAMAHGSDAQLVIRGRESFALLQFDLSAVRDLKIERATLRVHRSPDRAPLHTVGLSTISGNGAWTNQATFFSPGDGKPWSYAGSDLVDVSFGQGGSLYAYRRAREAGGGWYEIDVPAPIATALAAGDQFGLMLTDEKGQTQTRHLVSSRESASPPLLIVEGTRLAPWVAGPLQSLKTSMESTPAEARALGRTTLRPGSVILRFRGTGMRSDVRYSVSPVTGANFDQATPVPRWSMNSLAPKTHPLETSNKTHEEVSAVVEGLQPGTVYYFAGRATNLAGRSGPVTPLGQYRAYARSFPSLPAAGKTLSPAKPEAGGDVRVWAVPELLKIHPQTGAVLEQDSASSVWDAQSRTVSLTGARNEFLGFQLAIQSARPLPRIEVSVAKPPFPPARIELFREWFVPDDKGWYPDALIPLAAPFELPARDNAVPGQTVQPVFVDVYIPHEAGPGTHTGALLVRAGEFRREIALRVEVLPLRLPDKLNFTVDLNCYSGVDSGYQVRRGTPEYRRLEQAYHRLAHLHRTNLDVLGYSHNGSTVPDHAPPLEGEAAATKVRSWEDWDAHFGPLLDGSAFADLPRARVPVQAMYLPFFENWPGDLRKSYRHNNYPVAKTEEEYREIIARHALEAAPIEEAFTQEYQERYAAVVAQFAEHLRERGWLQTKYLVYFNDKYYYKRPSQGGRGISWWLMDEPNHRDDVRASSFLGHLTRRGLAKYPDVPILLRTDISRVEWIRDLLAGQIDLNCISKRFFEKNRYLMDDRYRFGREYWNYASTNHPRDTNVAMRAWCWRVWLNGGEGIIPWNAVRGAEAWNRAEPLTVFYPGTKFGKDEPFPSLRLKAYRRGQQDIEYLVLLAQRPGWDREAVARAVNQALDLSGEVRVEHAEDAGTINFQNVKDSQFEQLRLRVAAAGKGDRRIY